MANRAGRQLWKDREPWSLGHTEQAMKQYVTTALAELAEHQHQER
jgi:hypothetical protein